MYLGDAQSARNGWLGLPFFFRTMNQANIIIQGKTYPVVFSMKTLIGFEDIVNRSFFEEKFDKMSSRMALVIAAINAADPNADITAKQLLDISDWQQAKEVVAAYNTVMELAAEFFRIPTVEPKDGPTAEGEQPKN